MFDNAHIQKYAFEDVPLDRDIYLMDEKWMPEYEKALVDRLNGGAYTVVGYISHAAARSIGPSAIELSWYPNILDRFHEVKIWLPRVEFITCIDCYEIDEKPRIFVKTEWLSSIYLRENSVFAMVDAIGVKSALTSGTLTREKLVELRDRLDEIAKDHPEISFISFADSLLIKSNWTVGMYNSNIEYTYEPELFLRLLPRIQAAYQDILGMKIYSILTQGSNAYYSDALLHISSTKNHISLNSLGLPFAQLLSIDRAIRAAIKTGVHGPSELYIDEDLYHSLRFDHKFGSNAQPKSHYQSPMGTADCFYFYNSLQVILDHLEA